MRSAVQEGSRGSENVDENRGRHQGRRSQNRAARQRIRHFEPVRLRESADHHSAAKHSQTGGGHAFEFENHAEPLGGHSPFPLVRGERPPFVDQSADPFVAGLVQAVRGIPASVAVDTRLVGAFRDYEQSQPSSTAHQPGIPVILSNFCTIFWG